VTFEKQWEKFKERNNFFALLLMKGISKCYVISLRKRVGRTGLRKVVSSRFRNCGKVRFGGGVTGQKLWGS